MIIGFEAYFDVLSSDFIADGAEIEVFRKIEEDAVAAETNMRNIRGIMSHHIFNKYSFCFNSALDLCSCLLKDTPF